MNKLWRKIVTAWRVWRDKECYKCGSTDLYISAGSSPGVYCVKCLDCGMFIVKQSF